MAKENEITINQDYDNLTCHLSDARVKIAEPKEQVSHPSHYQGSCAESWDLSVLEWGPEYAIAAWVVQAQQYYDRYKEKNGVQDLKKALTFLDHALATDKYFRDNTLKDIPMHDGFWVKTTFLRTLIIQAKEEEEGK